MVGRGRCHLQCPCSDVKERWYALPTPFPWNRHLKPTLLTHTRNGTQVFLSGIGPALMMAPAAMVQYTLMDPLRGAMPLILAAAIAGALDITIKCPFDRLKTKLQGTGERTSVLKLLNGAWREAGIRGLWAGNGATLVRV